MANIVSRAIVAYVPVLHQGYLNFFEKYADADLWLISRDAMGLKKDIRAVDVEKMKAAIEALAIFERVGVWVEGQDLREYGELIFPDDEVMRLKAKNYSETHKITFDSIFLRWDSKRSLDKKNVEPDVEITTEALHQEFMSQAEALADKSADWWRQIGGVIAKDGDIILSAYNRHVPSEQQPYFDGDPRGNFHKGEYIEISTALHSEAGLIAEAARRGVSLEGTDLYTTTFPCPNCAKLVAYSGIKRVFFREGYSMVDGEELMKNRGVEIIKVIEE
jgi:dCMP deaminase